MEQPHYMMGGTYQVGGTRSLWLNITYNYASYYYEVTDGDERFAHREVSYYNSDGTEGPIVTEYGLRGLYGKTGAETIPLIKDMIRRIEEKYKKDGEWITTKRDKTSFYQNGKEVDYVYGVMHADECIRKDYVEDVSEGPNEDYWEPTAGNAIKPLYQLIALAQMRPDGVWRGD